MNINDLSDDAFWEWFHKEGDEEPVYAWKECRRRAEILIREARDVVEQERTKGFEQGIVYAQYEVTKEELETERRKAFEAGWRSGIDRDAVELTKEHAYLAWRERQK